MPTFPAACGRGLPALRRIAALVLLLVLAACNGVAPTHTWQHVERGLLDAALSANGRYAALASLDAGTGLWDLTRDVRLYRWSHLDEGPDNITHIAIARDGSHVITADKRTWVVWDTATGKGLGYWSIDADITAVAIADGGRFVLIGLEDGRALHIDQRSLRRLEVIAHRGEAVTAVSLSADGSRAATAGLDRRAVVWDAAKGRELAIHAHDSRVMMVMLDSRGQRLFSADNRGGALVSAVGDSTGPVRLPLGARRYVVSAAAFSADGARLLTGFPGGEVALWDTTTAERLRSYVASGRSLLSQGNVIQALAFGGDSKSVIAEGSNGQALRWLL